MPVQENSISGKSGLIIQIPRLLNWVLAQKLKTPFKGYFPGRNDLKGFLRIFNAPPGFINKPYDAIHKGDIVWVHFEFCALPYPLSGDDSGIKDTRFHSEYRGTIKSRAIIANPVFFPCKTIEKYEEREVILFITLSDSDFQIYPGK